MKHELTTEIDIAAPRHTVWGILTDLDAQTLPGFEAMNAALKHRAEAHQAVGL